MGAPGRPHAAPVRVMNAATATETPTSRVARHLEAFGSVQALSDVDFEVRAGEVMALVGDNGAGKSTLIKCVAGIHTSDSGEILFEGQPVTIHGPKDSARLGIEVVYQDLALCDNLDVVQNMFLGREVHNVFQLLNESEMEARTRETMKGLSVTTIRSIRQHVATLSGGQRQSVAVARAVLWNSKLVILDEPTAALGVAQTQQVLDLVRRLARSGARRRAHLAQPPRHLRGRRPHHRAAPRPQHRRLRPPEDHAAGARRRRSPPACPPRSPGFRQPESRRGVSTQPSRGAAAARAERHRRRTRTGSWTTSAPGTWGAGPSSSRCC